MKCCRSLVCDAPRRCAFYHLFRIILIVFLTLAVSQLSFSQEWFHNGPDGAEVTAVAIASTDPSIMYVGTRYYGIFRSVDGGATFQSYSDGLPAFPEASAETQWWNGDHPPVLSIDIDPLNPDVAFAGFHHQTLESTLIAKTVDGGQSWTVLEEGLPICERVSDIWIDDTNTDHIIIASDSPGGLWESINGGDSFALIEDVVSSEGHYFIFIRQSPANPLLLYAGFGGIGDIQPFWGLYRSEDRGETWSAIYTDQTVMDIAFDQHDPNLAYASIYTPIMEKRLAFTVDGGATWNMTYLVDDAEVLHSDSDNNFYVSNSHYAFFMKAHDSEAWVNISQNLSFIRRCYSFHPLCIETDPGIGNALYVGSMHGLFRTVDAGETYQPVIEGIDNTFIYDIVSDPYDSSILYCAERYGLWRSDNSGVDWNRIHHGYETSDIDTDPQIPGRLYAVDGGSILVSNDHGDTWEDLVSPVTLSLQAIELDHTTGTIHITNGGSYLWTDDDGETWNRTDMPGSPVYTIACNPYNSSVYIGTSEGLLIAEPPELDAYLLNYYGEVRDIVFLSDNEMIFTANNGVLYSQDGGSSALPVRGFEEYEIERALCLDHISENDETTLFIGTSQGVFSTVLHSNTWHPVEGPYNPRATALHYHPQDGTLFIGTRGSGIWHRSLLSSADDVFSDPSLPPSFALSVYPNPCNSTTVVQLEIGRVDSYTLNVYNILGQLVFRDRLGRLTQGIYSQHYPSLYRNLSSGVFFMQLESSTNTVQQKVTILK